MLNSVLGSLRSGDRKVSCLVCLVRSFYVASPGRRLVRDCARTHKRAHGAPRPAQPATRKKKMRSLCALNSSYLSLVLGFGFSLVARAALIGSMPATAAASSSRQRNFSGVFTSAPCRGLTALLGVTTRARGEGARSRERQHEKKKKNNEARMQIRERSGPYMRRAYASESSSRRHHSPLSPASLLLLPPASEEAERICRSSVCEACRSQSGRSG